ncbi:contractile injection system tape measure protein [Dyadobacter sandarakinus]|uniref:Uncharacterized protein n=1 Tax=Dyadobacter sandarakinus TaxID=2747268 RepID=A0ABX7I3G4_9BACT|nr:contractile injection system tape measure protein [Dyadobacter sandarakinus]QRR00604.1 hypothetical protein HWI92_06630 [Dyadobacter sandarakinus]
MDHTLQKLRINVEATSREGARNAANEVAGWCRSERFWAGLATRLDDLLPGDRVVVIPKLEIHVAAENEMDFQRILAEKIIACLSDWPQADPDDTPVTIESYLMAQAMQFLKYGYFPVGVPPVLAEKIKELLIRWIAEADAHYWQELASLASAEPQMLDRLIQHFGSTRVRSSIARWMREESGIMVDTEVVASFFLKKAGSTFADAGSMSAEERRFWRWFLRLKTKTNLQEEADLENAVSREAPERAGRPEHTSKHRAVQPEQDVFFVENAGLVLLTPFLPQLFEALKWTENNAWISENTMGLAVRLLDYIAHGTTKNWENDWVLPKILCGMPVHEVVVQHVPLEPHVVLLADELLEAVIAYWSALKTISPDRLREMFLRRQGKLTIIEDGPGWQLRVDRKAQDILLSRIPWGFGVTRLPWMQDMLFVDWA